MRNTNEFAGWQKYLSDFSERNNMRPTRLEVLGPDREVVSDFWLEDGLLLQGITLETDRDDGPRVEIMLRAPAGATDGHMTHTVTGVKRLQIDRADGPEEILEVEDYEGAVTIMRFESESDRVIHGGGGVDAMRRTLLTLCFVMLLSLTTTAQTKTFARHGLGYALDLPSPAWRAVPRIDVHSHFEFINGNDYRNGIGCGILRAPGARGRRTDCLQPLANPLCAAPTPAPSKDLRHLQMRARDHSSFRSMRSFKGMSVALLETNQNQIFGGAQVVGIEPAAKMTMRRLWPRFQ